MAAIQKDVKWRGTKDLVPGKIHWDFQAEKTVATGDWQGPYSTCLAKRPVIGQTIAGMPADLLVVSCRVTELDGDAGRIDVVLEAVQPVTDVSTAVIGEPIYELDFQELQKPLETHADCGILIPERPAVGGKKKTWDDWADLTNDDYAEGGWTLEEYQEMRREGIDSFSVGFPIVRRTLYYFRDPGGVGAGCFEPQAPPFAAGAPTSVGGQAIEYLKGIDKIVKEGRLRTRVTEWLGAWNWKNEIYGGS